MIEKINLHKKAKWEKIYAFEERKISLDEQKRKDDKIAEDDRFMMMEDRKSVV